MEFEFNWPGGFWENYVLICWWNSNMSDFGWKVNGQPWSLKLILKAIKNATGTSVIFHINISLIYFVFVLTSIPNVGERFTQTWA